MYPTSLPKLLPWPSAVNVRAKARTAGQVVVWTNGCFDLFHVGHLRSLEAARQLGDLLFVGLNSDKSVRQLKGEGRPIQPVAQRAEILAALSPVDFIVVFDEQTPEHALTRLQPDIHCKGADYAPPKGKPIPEAAVVESYGGQVKFLPLIPGYSTSDLIRRIRELP